MGVEALRSEFESILAKQIDTAKANNFNDRSSTGFSSTMTESFSFVESGDSQNNDQVKELRRIVQKLDSDGYNIGDCVKLYKNSRKLALDDKFRYLGIGKCSIDEIKNMDWELLDPKMKSWNKEAPRCFGNLFVKEKVLYDQIFGGLHFFAYDVGFLGIVYEFAMRLINFAQGVSVNKVSFMKLFEVLEVYETLASKVFPSLDAVFLSNFSESVSIHDKAAQTLDMLAKSIRRMLSVFESSVHGEKTNNTSISGGIIRVTDFAMDYITRLVNHKEVLAKLIVSQPTDSKEIDDDLVYSEASGKSPFELHLILIIRSLKYNLMRKSEFYNDVPLRFFVHDEQCKLYYSEN